MKRSEIKEGVRVELPENEEEGGAPMTALPDELVEKIIRIGSRGLDRCLWEFEHGRRCPTDHSCVTWAEFLVVLALEGKEVPR